jgi:hypothetical protein
MVKKNPRSESFLAELLDGVEIDFGLILLRRQCDFNQHVNIHHPWNGTVMFHLSFEQRYTFVQ